MTTYLRSLSVVALAASAIASQAATFVFDFSSTGSFWHAGMYDVEDIVLPGAGADDSTSPVKSMSYHYADSALTSGVGTIRLTDGISQIDFKFDGSITSNNPNSNALNGTVVSFMNGTGVLSGLVGTGSISNTLRWQGDGNEGASRSTFYAELNPVPEPASMAALALGVAAMARKRRK